MSSDELADRESLSMKLIESDMRDLSQFVDNSFDLIFHPCSNCFIPDVNVVWREAYRVLKSGGHLLSGFVNPIIFTTDLAKEREGIAQLKYKIPFSEQDHLDDPEIKKLHDKGEPIYFGHSLEDQLGGQTATGFHIVDLFEDSWPNDSSPLQKYINCYMATRALKI